MSRTHHVRRSLAATAALVVATWGALALPAAADHGNGNGGGNGNGHSHANDDADTSAKDKDKSGKKSDKGDKSKNDEDKNAPQGPKDKGDKAPQGPKDKGDKAPQGPKDKGDKGNSGGGGGNGGGKGDKGDPAGNNGTVKITPVGEADGIPNNSPHPGCEFDIEWYGFDEGPEIVSEVVFAMHAPTKDVGLSGTDPAEVFVGGDPATGAGTETGFDGEATYHLVFDGEPHPKQGYHVKLTVHTPGSKGADTKHKVFWVEPCEDEVAGDEEADTEGTTGEGGEGDKESTEVLGEQASTGDDDEDTEVMGAQASAPGSASADENVPTAVDAGEEGNPVVAFITSPLPLVVLGLGLVLGAAALLARRRPGADS